MKDLSESASTQEVVASPICQEDFMKVYECGKETEHHFTARFISDPKELHPTLKK